MKKVIAIVGPTGVGKTKLSIELAKKFNGEVINADSMQVYRGLDIGTAKVRKDEMEGIPHHLFDIKDLDEEYTIYHYQKDCRKVIDEVLERGHIPILVGGTGLYIKSALYDYQLLENKLDASIYDDVSTADLYHKLIQVDSCASLKIDPNNRRRIVNALMYYEKNGSSITLNRTNCCLYDVCFIGLTTDREELYARIDERVDWMIQHGLVEEVEKFYNKGILTKPLLGGIGYKEIIAYLKKDISLDEAILEIKKNSRHYAKRQYTFFKNQLPVVWFDTNYENFDKTVLEVSCYLEEC